VNSSAPVAACSCGINYRNISPNFLISALQQTHKQPAINAAGFLLARRKVCVFNSLELMQKTGDYSKEIHRINLRRMANASNAACKGPSIVSMVTSDFAATVCPLGSGLCKAITLML
jgi:hypothetical protein